MIDTRTMWTATCDECGCELCEYVPRELLIPTLKVYGWCILDGGERVLCDRCAKEVEE